MLLNAPLIPLFLGIFVNVSKESDFDPEYLFEVNKTVIDYRKWGKIFQTTQLNSTITCHPFLIQSLQCDLHDVMISEYSNWTQSVMSVTEKRLEVEQSFKMDFDDCGLQRIFKKNQTRLINNLIYDIGRNFNLFFDIRTHASRSSLVKNQTFDYTCDITYDIDMTHMKKNGLKETNSNFQIKLLTEDFSNQKDSRIYIHNVYIVHNKTDCTSLGFHHSTPLDSISLESDIIAECIHTISVTDNKLKIFSKLELEDSDSFIIYAVHVNLIDIRSRENI